MGGKLSTQSGHDDATTEQQTNNQENSSENNNPGQGILREDPQQLLNLLNIHIAQTAINHLVNGLNLEFNGNSSQEQEDSEPNDSLSAMGENLSTQSDHDDATTEQQTNNQENSSENNNPGQGILREDPQQLLNLLNFSQLLMNSIINDVQEDSEPNDGNDDGEEQEGAMLDPLAFLRALAAQHTLTDDVDVLKIQPSIYQRIFEKLHRDENEVERIRNIGQMSEEEEEGPRVSDSEFQRGEDGGVENDVNTVDDDCMEEEEEEQLVKEPEQHEGKREVDEIEKDEKGKEGQGNEGAGEGAEARRMAEKGNNKIGPNELPGLLCKKCGNDSAASKLFLECEKCLVVSETHCSSECLEEGRKLHSFDLTHFKAMNGKLQHDLDLVERHDGRRFGTLKDVPGIEHEFFGGSKISVVLKLGQKAKGYDNAFLCQDIEGQTALLEFQNPLQRAIMTKMVQQQSHIYFALRRASFNAASSRASSSSPATSAAAAPTSNRYEASQRVMSATIASISDICILDTAGDGFSCARFQLPKF